jgi:hypothetical protein
MTDPHTIARSLSQAQRKALRTAEPRKRAHDPDSLFFTDTRGCGDLKALGLGFVTLNGLMLTDTAMAVRAIIEEEGI